MFVSNIINRTYEEEKANSVWDNSPYKHLIDLTIDKRGKVGEMLVSEALKSTNLEDINILEDVTDVNIKGDSVHYDININGLKIEIKTAYQGTNRNWQHENLYSAACDMAIFVDFLPEGFYVSVFSEEELPLGRESEIFPKRHATLRKNKDDGYKFDFSNTTYKGLAAYGDTYARFFTEADSSQEIGNFIAERIVNRCGNYLKE